jgi:hypothetical protein
VLKSKIFVAVACVGTAAALAACQQEPKVVASAAPASAAPLAAASTTPFHTYERVLRTQDITLQIPKSGDANAEQEYVVQMNTGDTLVYSWSVKGPDGSEFYYELHGQDPSDIDKVIASFEKQMGASGNGAFTVTEPGQYGWFFQNQSMKPATVTLHISGFYDPVPKSK